MRAGGRRKDRRQRGEIGKKRQQGRGNKQGEVKNEKDGRSREKKDGRGEKISPRRPLEKKRISERRGSSGGGRGSK